MLASRARTGTDEDTAQAGITMPGAEPTPTAVQGREGIGLQSGQSAK